MLFDRTRGAKHCLIALGAFVALSSPATAGMSESEYLRALKIAQKKVEGRSSRLSQARLQPGGSLPFARAYQVGDRWEVAAWQRDTGMMRKIDDPTHAHPAGGKLGIFRYEVTAVSPEVTLKITQLSEVDSRFESMTLVMGSGAAQSSKSYRLRSGSRALHVSPQGIRSRMTVLELFPLDIPEISGAEEFRPESFPELPETLAQALARSGYSIDLERTVGFEQDDFFGRPIRALWQTGDPWPAYLSTPGGVAVLIRKEVK